MLPLIFVLVAAGLFLDVYLPAVVAVIAVAFVLIVTLAVIAIMGIQRWQDRGAERKADEQAHR